jgi:hypothetical protein
MTQMIRIIALVGVLAFSTFVHAESEPEERTFLTYKEYVALTPQKKIIYLHALKKFVVEASKTFQPDQVSRFEFIKLFIEEAEALPPIVPNLGQVRDGNGKIKKAVVRDAAGPIQATASNASFKFGYARCLYSGFLIVDQETCSAITDISQYKPYAGLVMPDGVTGFKCTKSGTTLCNPMIFGFKKGGEAHCVSKKLNATDLCMAASAETDKDAHMEFLLKNKEKFEGYISALENLCKRGDPDDKWWETNFKFVKNSRDLQKTCLATKQKGLEVKDQLRKYENLKKQMNGPSQGI